MKRLAGLCGAVLLLACLWGSSASAAVLNLTPTGGAKFPERQFLLTLSGKGALSANQISITENGQPVSRLTLEPASKVGESHFGTVLLVDTSDSMAGVAEQSAIAAMRTFVSSRNPAQPVGIVFFDQTARIVVPMTTSNSTLDAALASVPSLHSGTHIFDAVSTALKMLASAQLTGGSVVLASDGRDTGSTVSEQSVAASAATSGVRFYTVGVRDPSFDGTTLSSLAAATGGTYTPATSTSLSTLYHDLGVALSNQYVVRYLSRSTLGSKVSVSASVSGHGNTTTSYTAPPIPSLGSAGPAGGSSSGGTSFWQSSGAAVLVSVLCAALIFLAIFAILSRRTGVRGRVGQFVGLITPQLIEDRPRSLVQRALGESRDRAIRRSGWTAVLAEEMDVARIRISLSRLLLLTVLATVLVAYLLATVEGPIAVPLALVIPFIARFAIRIAATRTRRTFDDQLPDNLSVVASALRAGNTFAGSLGVVASDAPEPSRRELRRALADEQLGVPLVDALNRVSERMRSTEFQHVALVATLQAETGGNTAEVLDVVTETIRERLELRRMVRTLTAQGRLAGIILSAMPVLLLLAISFINPHYTHPLFHKVAGIIALAVAGVMVTTGSIVIRRIVNIDV